MIEQYLKEKDNVYIFDGNMMKVYIPKKYIDSPLYHISENFTVVFGVLPVAICDKSGKPQVIEIMNAPYPINMYNINFEIEKDLVFFNNTPEDYQVYSFYKGDKFIKSSLINSNDNFDLFLKYLMNAKVVNYISYEQLIYAFDKLLLDNNTNLNIPHTVKEVLIASVCRNPEKTEELFGNLVGKNPSTNQRKYTVLNTRQIAAKSSVSTSIAFEDMDSMIISGINTTSHNKKMPDSPIENILTM